MPLSVALLLDAPIRTATPGEVLAARLSVPQTALYLQSGRVVAGLLQRGALRHRLVEFKGPCWLDAASALLEQPSACDWVADGPVALRTLPAAALRRWHAGLPEAAARMLIDMAQAQRRQTEATLALLAQDAEARCAQWLLQHARRADDGRVGIELQLRKRTIAAQLGMAPETFSRVLRQLRERGLVLQAGKQLLLPDPSQLQQIAAD
ncbi:Crp/Fnr family transcriptional regulator [Pseudorhodoferax soli]|uniref:CRP-like cAMP-binding protein n=1 Tax=Pseudorhodoferax soli TaxID=545864 RepID=A0A368XT60_9BURK|nr:Crp/Fnr family transcriptional regulator [Pseudorhodoferax soli]RCW71240.1 CRP-like cAMP-binding protein [Pseudorhodoferax soli]